MANAMMFDEYQVSWNCNSSSRTLIPFSFGIISSVCLFPVNKHQSNVQYTPAAFSLDPVRGRRENSCLEVMVMDQVAGRTESLTNVTLLN
jgi:hypothetical protein